MGKIIESSHFRRVLCVGETENQHDRLYFLMYATRLQDICCTFATKKRRKQAKPAFRSHTFNKRFHQQKMTKNAIRHIFWALTTCFVLMMPFFPHHHHGAEICMVMEYCEDDHTVNDEHTGHHDDAGQCTVKNGLFLAKPTVSSDSFHVDVLPVSAWTARQWHLDDTLLLEHALSPCSHTPSLALGACRAHGLRAPPVFFS